MNMLDNLFRSIRKTPDLPAGPVEFIVAGLGNPGKEYETTRHNAGFMAVDAIARKFGCKVDRIKYKSLCGECMIGDKKVLLMKPSTYMNNSGEALREAMNFYKIPSDRALIIFDDISIGFATMRIRKKGSDGGHNGMKNIIYLSGKDDFPRIKIGVGAKPHPDYELAKWVLSKFSSDELSELDKLNLKVCEAVELIVNGNMEKAMNSYNGK
ncbi:MAG: aminoacyl-tRNA hydrolase [Oscillospiraceae bacterium]|nr:aminoacyl-tRNA hydrolase [Oscillospiraceae bacterium]MBQ3049933.1 aminoacyl-tRNA hydrolase [Oscillospiraceae bacterium]